jgi:hypothetical protein
MRGPQFGNPKKPESGRLRAGWLDIHLAPIVSYATALRNEHKGMPRPDYVSSCLAAGS